ncbi:hypothetical protein LU290_10340 [Moraxella nasibovis]|uniref:hypothetical protein n=1 Tax=Moraxella nasibovis TaxID=2904120 RepID=UPI00240F99E5|nr:hypothetical protein [Moraxella nasibovis]WFF38619.1 hypothetical protein LU290_10340 [Moraxella nasibovis]
MSGAEKGLPNPKNNINLDWTTTKPNQGLPKRQISTNLKGLSTQNLTLDMFDTSDSWKEWYLNLDNEDIFNLNQKRQPK